MARKAGDSGPRTLAAGMAGWTNGIPPPSTIAAQIVNNHSRANGAQEPQNNVLFGQLLQEFLADPSAEESDVRLNLQLISVVVEAGFNALLKENPFGRDVLLSQAKDGISVIRITIERNPGLLFYHDPSGADHTTQPPLVAKLLPTLFSLLSRPPLQALHADLRDLLHSFIQVLSISRNTWHEANVLFETYQTSISGLISQNRLYDLTADRVCSHPYDSGKSMLGLTCKSFLQGYTAST
ncbi:Phosphatidylinositol 3-/4-kinase catalytic [Lasiodiplodia theobromae]|nr:Phosphatidylinositol 3-/4-kinase catalytic [Lasiodiplodia theobromae]